MIKFYKKRQWLISFLLLLFVLVANTAIVRAESQVGTSQAALTQGRNVIKYYYLDQVPQEALEKDNLKDAVKALNDPYSAYFTAKEYNDFVSSVNNKFSGIGINMDVSAEGVKVLSVINSSPALEAGIKAGDILVEAEGQPLIGLPSEQVVKIIRGEPGTYVNIKVKRGQELVDFKIVRREIVLPTVNSSLLDKHIGYLQITSFGEDTLSEFGTQLDKLIKQKADSYIIDLRYNSGGYMNMAIEIAGYFIGKETALQVKDKAGNTETMSSQARNQIIDKPVIFLVNQYSASASEILAGAVKDYKKAFFIGEKTYGKGVAQSIFSLSDGSYLKLTTMKFFSPKGNEIHKVGITPDLEVKSEEADLQKPLQIAQLLLSNPVTNNDKSSAVRVGIKDNYFEIDSNMLKNPEFKNAAKFLSDSVMTADNTYVWNNGGWIKASSIISDTGNNEQGNTADNNQKEEQKLETKQPELQQVANTETKQILPATGAAIDFKVFLSIGFLAIIVGLSILNSRRTKNIN